MALLVMAPACAGFDTGTPAEASSGPDPADQPAGSHPPSQYVPVGKIVADSGFRPETQGFGFENYGTVLPAGEEATNLTPADVRTMFGDEVCADASATTCHLIPEAELWLEETNAEMSLGHCYGFAVSSSLMWQNTLPPSEFGGDQPVALAIDDNEGLQRRIAYDWAAQLLESVRSKVLQGTPKQVLNSLKDVLQPNPKELYTIVLWKKDGTGGHAVTPFAVEDLGDGKFNALIYDNNWPTETRAIAFDTKKNTWSYDAAINPDEPDEIYTGDSESNNLVLFPASPGLGDQECPFCGSRSDSESGDTAGRTAGSAAGAGAAAAQPATTQIFLRGSDMGHADLLIKDSSGRRLGFVDGKLVQEIPGARVDRLLSNQNWRATIEPHFVVPADGHYTITLEGGSLEHDDLETLGVIGPAFLVAVKDIEVKPGDKNVLTVGLDGETITYTSSRSQTPTIRVGMSEENAAYDFELRGVTEQPGSHVKLELPINSGKLRVTDEGSGVTSHVSLQMRRFSKSGVDVFRAHGVNLPGEDTAELRFGAWNGELRETIPLAVTRGRHTTTHFLRNDAIPSAG